MMQPAVITHTQPTGHLAVEWLDVRFDPVLENRTQLTWLPWIGCRFGSYPLRTMILGESTYNWKPGEETVLNRIARRDHLRVLHKNHALNFERQSKYVRNIERAVFGVRRPSATAKSAFWLGTVYHNLVLRPMASQKHRPSEQDYAQGWAEALSLMELLAVDQCLVYGLESTKLAALRQVCIESNYALIALPSLEKVGKSTPRAFTLTKGSYSVKLLFIRHPSAYFSWKGWARIIRTTMVLEHFDEAG